MTLLMVDRKSILSMKNVLLISNNLIIIIIQHLYSTLKSYKGYGGAGGYGDASIEQAGEENCVGNTNPEVVVVVYT